MPAKTDLSGLVFGKLTVLHEVPRSERKNDKNVEWECQGECGKITRVITAYLKNGHTKSCGCMRREIPAEKFSCNLVGQKFAKLEVLEKTDRRGADGSIIWKCRCDCGNITYVSTNSLHTGGIQSCGCFRSKGEKRINEILFEHGVNYQTQYWFSDLKDKKYLYFDFGIINDDKTIKCLVEYQGIQHYHPEALHGAWKNSPQTHDEIKREYCHQHGIKLVEIPYTDFDKLSWEYLKDRLEL